MIEVVDLSTYTHSISAYAILRVESTATGSIVHINGGDTVETNETRTSIVLQIQNAYSFYTP